MRVIVENMSTLSDHLADRWRTLQALTPAFLTPLLSPEFAYLAARHRPGTRVAVGYEGDEAVAFFGFHKTGSGYARAIGAPFCDYQAIVSDPAVALDGPAFLAKAGIASVHFTSLMDPHGVFQTSAMAVVDGYRINCQGDSDAYVGSLKAANGKWAKNVRRVLAKLDREMGPVRLVANDTNRASYNTLMDIKIAQYYETGVTNVLRPSWVKAFMQELFDDQNGAFGGCMVSLYAGDKFVAGQFGARQDSWFHPWIAATCPLSHAYSPGIVFLYELVRQSNALGIDIIDLAGGHGHYKSQFCRDPIKVHAGVVGANPHTAPSQGVGALATIGRRLDLIRTVEPDLMGKLTAIGMTIAAVPRRLAARRSKNEHQAVS